MLILLAVCLTVILFVILSCWIQCWRLRYIIQEKQKEIDTIGRSTTAIAKETADELAKLKEQISNQKTTIELLQAKPDKKELRQLRLYTESYAMMVERVPGFAQVWQNCIREIEEKEKQEAEGKYIFHPIQVLTGLFSKTKQARLSGPEQQSPAKNMEIN